jgi:MinD-like ATPase involved in chromosome partitioning or flagellar assembly
MCCALRDISLYRSMDRYPQMHEAMRLLNSFAPQILFLDVDDEEAALSLASNIDSFLPALTMVGVSSRADDLSRRSAMFGTLPILHSGCSIETFRAAIHGALEARSNAKNASVFAFLPSKAGSGATTTALFVTNILSNIVHKKVLLLECDLHAGPVSMLCKFRPEYSIMDALEDSHRLTDESWNRLTTRLNGMDVLPSVSRLGVRHVSAWAYQRLLAFARPRYDLIVCDLPEVVNEATEVAVRAAKAVLVVTTPSVPSLRLAERRRSDLLARGVGAAKVKYVLSRRLEGQTIPRAMNEELEASQIADIPMDKNLCDVSEFNPQAAKAATLAECVKIAEFCSGESIDSAGRGKRRFFTSRWFGVPWRVPQLYVEPVGRS